MIHVFMRRILIEIPCCSLCSPEFGVKPHDYPVRPLHQQAPSPLQTHTETVRVRIRDPQQEALGVGRNRNDPKEQYKRRSCSVLDAKELKMLGEYLFQCVKVGVVLLKVYSAAQWLLKL